MKKENENCVDILLAANAGLIPELAPPVDARKRILANILQCTAAPIMQVVRHNEGEWREIFPGVTIKLLREDIAERSQTTLWRMQPGASVPRHQHSQNEECLVLEGSLVQAGIEYFPGDYLLSPIGLTHDHFVAPQGALFLIRGEIIGKSMLV